MHWLGTEKRLDSGMPPIHSDGLSRRPAQTRAEDFADKFKSSVDGREDGPAAGDVLG